jgi:transcriptional regulator with XRE-family HTH domain
MNGTFYMVDQAITDGVRDVLARNLRRLRIARHLSLSELARATRMSKATLSSIENGRANPTVETLAGLAAALRISLIELLEELPVGEVRIVRAAVARVNQRDGIRQRTLGELVVDGGVRIAEIALAEGGVHEIDARASGSRAHVFVLQGKLIAGPVERSTELGTGDYASFPTDVPHVYAAGRHLARALLLSEEPR